MSDLRVLQVLPALNIGGVERATLDMAAALRQVSSHTYVASEGGVLLPELARLGGTHLPLPANSKNPLQLLRNAFTLAQIIRKHDIQVIHARSRAPAWSALWAARWTKTPFVTTYHGTYLSTNALKTFYNSVMTRGDRVIAISEFIARYIDQNHPTCSSPVNLIREGIDTDIFNPQKVSKEDTVALKKAWDIPKKAIVFLLPGRVSRIKGQAVFVEALRRLNHPDVVGVILGQNQGKSSYPEEVVRLSQGLPIRFIDNTPIPRVAYTMADFTVYPSIEPEAFGRVTAEAGAMERVVIATDHGATSELCQSGKTGYLIPPHNPDALVAAMKKALSLSSAERQTMGKAARAYIAENFTLSRMCNQTIDLYRELIL